MSIHQGIEIKTFEKAYRINDDGRVLKRSLKSNEYYHSSNGEVLVPTFVVERLENEAASMEFIRKYTDIPVPKLVDTYEEDGAHFLWMEFIPGVEMSQLTEEEQLKVIPQVRDVVTTLRGLGSAFSGGPTGILTPPFVVHAYHPSEWKQQFSAANRFVFCHGDMAQSNILVDPKTLKIAAIIDWEYAGFYPREHEIPFYESPEYSATQVDSDRFKPVVDQIIHFWKRSQVPAETGSIPRE